jgi:hypothetical protein
LPNSRQRVNNRSGWTLSGAAINLSAPVEAEGTGAMTVVVSGGITASWLGLKDANLFEKKVHYFKT